MSRRKSSLSDSPRRQNHHADTDDKISDLPDSILAHILSLLPTKNAVASSILSKRWKLLWTTASNLDFCCPADYTGAVDQFVQFVNHVLLLHKPGYFSKLSLTWEKGSIPFHVHTWISAAVARDVHELFVSVDISKLPIHVQSYMFSNERLKSLELKCSICITSEIVVLLPRLETLKLISVYFQSKEAFSKLIDGCPVLNYLVIHMDIGKMIEFDDISSFKCIISSTSLRRLDLRVYDNCQRSEGTVLCGVELDAPSLRYIKLQDQIYSIVIQQRLAFLDEAHIKLSAFRFPTGDPEYCSSFVEAFHAFGRAKTLTLSDQVIRALSSTTIKTETECNRLTRLDVIANRPYWSSLQEFIELSANLEHLTVNKGYLTYEDTFFKNSNWTKTNIVPRCLSNSLRTVSIVDYDGYHDELAMVDCILAHGSVLEVMQICFSEFVSDFKRKFELVQEISALPRKSPICKVNFHE